MPEASEAPIEIPANASLEEAIKFVELARGLPNDVPLRLDAKALETISTPYVLSLISAVESRADVKPPAIIVNSTDAFVNAFSDLGMFQELMKMEFAT